MFAWTASAGVASDAVDAEHARLVASRIPIHMCFIVVMIGAGSRLIPVFIRRYALVHTAGGACHAVATACFHGSSESLAHLPSKLPAECGILARLFVQQWLELRRSYTCIRYAV